jgi:fatty-acyl-CoA synthase
MSMEQPRRFNSGTALKGWVRALEATAPIAARPHYVLPDAIDDLSARFDGAPALLSETESLSFRELAERMNRYARWAIAENEPKGGTVALLMPNRPEYMAIWLGLLRAGGVAALVNTNLQGKALAHAIRIVKADHLIVASGLLQSFRSAEPHLEHVPRLWVHGEARGGLEARIDLAIAAYSGEPLAPAERREVTIDDRALYIYTSGTTGLPKAANVSHRRLMTWSHWFAGMLETTPQDRIYNCLPMYHSIGGTVATGAVLVNGGSVFVREKFSREAFWDEIVKWDCTLVQYIGELCRYLLNAPPHPLERAHKVRLFCGNGLQREIWRPFKERFLVPRILEFYAATEGNFSLFNLEELPGSVGRVPPFLSHRFSAALIRHDVETGTPVRDERGHCVACGPDEAGEAIGRIDKGSDGPGGRFEGYADEAQSENKILRNVFAPGDAWYRTGDLMRKDKDSFWYFVDRIGDTFRWKGENVSTQEVAQAISSFPGVLEAAAYGVLVPNTEGRAGMAALRSSADIDLDRLRRHIQERLPFYAAPLFLRLTSELDTTETFKQKKGELAREGFDPAQTNDPIYFDHRSQDRYVRLDQALFRRIVSGQIRL